jgi:hypothetical protein
MLDELLGKKNSATMIFIDNKSAIQLCKNPIFHERSKHIDTRFHYNRECVQDGKINVEYVPTGEQLADIMTKTLPRPRFQELRRKLGIIDLGN